jgi:hypothetical protein
MSHVHKIAHPRRCCLCLCLCEGLDHPIASVVEELLYIIHGREPVRAWGARDLVGLHALTVIYSGRDLSTYFDVYSPQRYEISRKLQMTIGNNNNRGRGRVHDDAPSCVWTALHLAVRRRVIHSRIAWLSICPSEAFVASLLNATDSQGDTLLMRACEENEVTTAMWLLFRPGIDVNVRNIRGQNALMIACFNHMDDDVACKILKSQGIDHRYVNTRDDVGNTALMWACTSGTDTVASLILNVPGVDVNTRNNKRDSPLLISCRLKLYAVALQILSVPGVDVNARNDEGDTALIIMCRDGLMGEDDRSLAFDVVCRLLAIPGIDTSAADDVQVTALSRLSSTRAERGEESTRAPLD